MIVSVQLHPGGDAFRAKEIARMVLGNVSNLNVLSNYALLAREGSNPVTGNAPVQIVSKIRRHRRAQSVWALVAKAAKRSAKMIELGEIKPWS